MVGISSDLLKKIGGNDLLIEEEKENSGKFWESLVSLFGDQIQESERLTPIEPKIFEDLTTNISNQYKDKSLVYFLSNNLSPFDRKENSQKELKTFVIASDLQRRKHLITNWYSPAYGLSESIGRYLIEEENMQLDYNLFNDQISLQEQELKRESIKKLTEEYGEDGLFIFRNAFPDSWLRSISTESHKTYFNPLVSFHYITDDRNSELIIIPKSSMTVRYVYDGRFKNLHFPEYSLMWEILDLGDRNEENLLTVKSIKGFGSRFNLVDEELKKHFWIRIIAKTKIIVKDKNSILRFKLNPYGE